jgi:hypothetical protein
VRSFCFSIIYKKDHFIKQNLLKTNLYLLFFREAVTGFLKEEELFSELSSRSEGFSDDPLSLSCLVFLALEDTRCTLFEENIFLLPEFFVAFCFR